MESPRFLIPSTLVPKEAIIFPILSPASCALISKATPIEAATSPNFKASLEASPSFPPSATKAAIPSTAIGSFFERFKISSLKACRLCPSLKSVTFLTSAIELSKSIATLMGAINAPAVATFSKRLPLKLSIFSRYESKDFPIWLSCF